MRYNKSTRINSSHNWLSCNLVKAFIINAPMNVMQLTQNIILSRVRFRGCWGWDLKSSHWVSNCQTLTLRGTMYVASHESLFNLTFFLDNRLLYTLIFSGNWTKFMVHINDCYVRYRVWNVSRGKTDSLKV